MSKRFLIYIILNICLLYTPLVFAQQNVIYDPRVERIQRTNYAQDAQINYLEKRIESLEKNNQELSKKILVLQKDLQREVEKQSLIIRKNNDFSTNKIDKALDTIRGFSVQLYNSQLINFIALFAFLMVVIGIIIYTLLTVKRMTRDALERENKVFIKEKINKVNQDFEKTLHSIVHSTINNAEI